MGTDIHLFAEYRWLNRDKKPVWTPMISGEDEFRDSLEWNPIGDYPRNYLEFAVLAGVRNGYGFAGCYTHDPIIPISKPRGIPVDTNLRLEVDHDPSWLTLDELINYEHWNDVVTVGGNMVPGHLSEAGPGPTTIKERCSYLWEVIIYLGQIYCKMWNLPHDHFRLTFYFGS